MTMMDTPTKLISVTPDAEKHMAYCARVSNPNNQENEKFSGLLRYCVKHQHWSIFEQAFMTLEINTTRGIAAQCLRHRSFTYQEFSQRYADSSLLAEKIPLPELRRQDTKNRQNSIDDIDNLYFHSIASATAGNCSIKIFLAPSAMSMCSFCVPFAERKSI